jgi:hypothetical protein
MMPATTYPVRLEGQPDEQLSRWLWLVKWFLVIPHLFALVFLWVTFWVLTVFAFFGILITGRYPRAVFDFNVGVMRWTWRVAFYSYAALGTDRYPPFTLAERPDYPATLDVAYPERLSRGLVLVKWWLLAIPHYLVIGFFLGGAGYVGWRWGDTALLGGSGLIAVLVLIGAVFLLFTGKVPRGAADFALGMNRWVVRVGAYAALMTDEYPPFRLDVGPVDSEPVVSTSDEPVSGTSAGRITAVVLGVLVMLAGLGMAGGGGVALWADQTQRDSNGYITSGTHHFSTSTQALSVEDVDLQWAPTWMLGHVRMRADSGNTIFMGIGSASDVSSYMGGVDHDRVMGAAPDRMMRQQYMASQFIQPPGQQGFWSASTSGSGTRELTWTVQNGQWALVVLNADASAEVSADLSVGATVPGLFAIGAGLLGLGVLAIAGGAWLQFAGLRSRRTRREG